MWAVVAGLAVAAAALAASGGLRRSREPGRLRATLSVPQVLGEEESLRGFARALSVRDFSFPRDHGPHPRFRNEWWYWTGNLETASGRHFGFQLTFFRTALSPMPAVRASAWATTQVYMAHFTLTDVAAGRFFAFERFSRGAMGLAGARADPFRVWLEDWSAVGRGGSAPLTLALHAADGDVAIELTLEAAKPVVLHGERGLSRKGAEAGNASYYYSFTRMATRGSVTVGSERYRVVGLSWMDREWSTSMLGKGQVGWDWFALQLDDGREVMFFRLRRKDAPAKGTGAGTLVHADGSTRALAAADVRVEVLDRWPSPGDGARYPARWRFRVPGERLDLEISPYVANQELRVAVRYWEGAVRVVGTADGRPVRGHGYVELTGYANGKTDQP
jgi:predicted secreted hydrolase